MVQKELFWAGGGFEWMIIYPKVLWRSVYGNVNPPNVEWAILIIDFETT